MVNVMPLPSPTDAESGSSLMSLQGYVEGNLFTGLLKQLSIASLKGVSMTQSPQIPPLRVHHFLSILQSPRNTLLPSHLYLSMIQQHTPLPPHHYLVIQSFRDAPPSLKHHFLSLLTTIQPSRNILQSSQHHFLSVIQSPQHTPPSHHPSLVALGHR